jgi:Uma2 family endonuclease
MFVPVAIVIPMAAPVIPPMLCDGDRLSRDEFLRRWELLPDLKHAQLLDGIVYMASAVSVKHSSFHADFTTWLGVYKARSPGCETHANGTALIEDDAPQPDIALRILPAFGGQSRDEGPYLAGPPELIVEVAASSKARDLGPKSRLYLRAGVREYVTALVEEERVVWRELHEGAWREVAADASGILRSRVFPGSCGSTSRQFGAATWRRCSRFSGKECAQRNTSHLYKR